MILDAGKAQGIKPGQAVVDARGMIGRIFLTGNHTAWVILLTDLNSRIPVNVEPGNAQAIMAGDNTARADARPALAERFAQARRAGGEFGRRRIVAAGPCGRNRRQRSVRRLSRRPACRSQFQRRRQCRRLQVEDRTTAGCSPSDLPATAAGLPPAAPPTIAPSVPPVTMPPVNAPVATPAPAATPPPATQAQGGAPADTGNE